MYSTALGYPEAHEVSKTRGMNGLIKGSEAMNGGAGGGGGEERPRKMIKKGPWSPQEDQLLTEYVRRHGEGNWNTVQRHTTLKRCGKSCRLRWANHLRPDLKKCAFSPEEESLVVRLHAEHGNKWAHMATLLPGRTDNEIKNFWNTRMKRLRRANSLTHPRKLCFAKTTESSPSYPSRTNGNAQPHPPFFGASSSQSNWPRPGEYQCHQLPEQSNIARLCRDLSAFSAGFYWPSSAVGVDLPSIQTKSLRAMVPSFCGGYSLFATLSDVWKSDLLGDMLAQAESLALKEEDKRKSESFGSNRDEAAASSSFSVEPNKEPIDEIERVDEDCSSLFASFTSTMQAKTLALEEEEEKNERVADDSAKAAASSSFSVESLLSSFTSTTQAKTLARKEEDKKNESLVGNGVEATTFSSFGVEPNKESIGEIKCADDDWSSLLASFVSAMQAKTLPLQEEDEKNECLGGDGNEAAASSSFAICVESNKEPINEIECKDDDWSNLLTSSASTMQAQVLALKEEENKKNESLGGVEPNKELTDEIECMDDDLSSLLASFASTIQAETQTLIEDENKKNESVGNDLAKAAASSSFNEYSTFHA